MARIGRSGLRVRMVCGEVRTIEKENLSGIGISIEKYRSRVEVNLLANADECFEDDFLHSQFLALILSINIALLCQSNFYDIS